MFQTCQAPALARVGQWRSMPLTIGLAVAIGAGAWHVWNMRDRLEASIRHEINVHNRDVSAHDQRIQSANEAWRQCLQLQQRVAAVESKLAALEEKPVTRRRR